MKMSNNKNSSIIETDEYASIYATNSGYTTSPYAIAFHNKRYSNSTSWSFKTKEERDKVFDIIKKKLGVIEINDTDIIL
jgi:hypothetical protein